MKSFSAFANPTDSADTFDLNVKDDHPVLSTTQEIGETGFVKIKTHTNVPSPNMKYMAGLSVTATVEDNGDPVTWGSTVALECRNYLFAYNHD